jgi:hypothetical protein
VVRIAPVPRRKSFIVILAIKLEPFDVLNDDFLELFVIAGIRNIKSGLIIKVFSLNNLFIDNLKIFYLIVILLVLLFIIQFLNSFVVDIVGAS